ncbi:MAG: Xaa-Pro peptidase family protein [Desulfuromonas thiophila]|nr:Xaa-Pro peptidase family protein [Desulfuromonas thiophila]
MLALRIDRLRSHLNHVGLDAVVLLNPLHLRYYAGFTGSDGVLVVGLTQTFFMTDSRYTTQAREQVRADAQQTYRQKPQGVRKALNELGANVVGCEGDYVTLTQFDQLQKACPAVRWQVLDDLAHLRQVKDASEVALLEQAARINAEAFTAVQNQIRPGLREVDLAVALEHAMRCGGGEDRAFDLIVASGVRGACPHGVASTKALASGELLTIDFGTRVQGYHSDETLTLALGPVPDALRRVYDIVLQAHDLALAVLTPGIPAREVDRVAREYIASQGYGACFGHGLGHGVGLAIHEGPTLSPHSEVLLTEGMVFTIEPGIYVPELGGVRIEDTVVLTSDGYRLLTRLPKTFCQLDVVAYHRR